jgi:hypothetical protein
MNVKISSCGEQENVNDSNSSMQHGTWGSRAQRKFTGKPGTNTVTPLKYFEFICAPEILHVTARETKWYAPKLLENTPILKLSYHWKDMNINEITKLLAFILLRASPDTG